MPSESVGPSDVYVQLYLQVYGGIVTVFRLCDIINRQLACILSLAIIIKIFTNQICALCHWLLA